MSLIDNLVARLPIPKQNQIKEYFFLLNIGPSFLTASLWTIDHGTLQVLNPVSDKYSGSDDIVEVADRLLDGALGGNQIEPEKILFGVPDSWLIDDDLKEPYLKLLQNLVKSLDLKPMAYVATSHAIAHLLEKSDGAPTTAILVGIGEENATVTVVRAGKVDGTKVVKRTDDLSQEIEKALASFTSVEVLPSRIMIYELPEGKPVDLDKQKSNLLSYPWMNKLSFLHFPKIEVIKNQVVTDAVALAGASEMDQNVKYVPSIDKVGVARSGNLLMVGEELETTGAAAGGMATNVKPTLAEGANVAPVEDGDFGFREGDVLEQNEQETSESEPSEEGGSQESSGPEVSNVEEVNSFGEGEERPLAGSEEQYAVDTPETELGRLPARTDNSELPSERISTDSPSSGFNFFEFLTGLVGNLRILAVPLVIIILVLAYLFLPQAKVTIYVEPKVVSSDTQVTADPKATAVDESTKTIPGKSVSTDISSTDSAPATGTKQVGDPAKGTVTIYNKTSGPKSFSKGDALTSSGGLKFTLNSDVNIASESATDTGITFGSSSADVTAAAIGADSNLPSGTDFSINGLPVDQVAAKSQGNFSGGTSKNITIVTDADQKKLLASLASQLRSQAAQKLQQSVSGKKVLPDGLSETITKKSYTKNVGDQADNFSLTLTVRYNGIAYAESDLKDIVSKLVSVNVPDGYQLDLADTQTQADVSKVENNKLTFLARFEAKLIPKLDTNTFKGKIKGKTPQQAADILKSYDNVLGSEIKIVPSLPGPLSRLPLLEKNIKIEVSLK